MPTPGPDAEQAPEPQVDEPQVDDSFDRLVEEGRARLCRSPLNQVGTALLGGIDIATGLLAYLVVEHQTGDTLLASLAFAIGFVALLLAHSELFTENFLVPVTAVAAREGSVRQLLVLWVVSLAGNLAGGWAVTWLVVAARPDLRPTAVEAGRHYAELPLDGHSFALAVLAGLVITLLTRMQHATDSLGVKLVPAILFGALLAGAQLFHSVLDSLFLFTGIHAGADYGYGDWLPRLGWSAAGNLVGGLGLVTALRLLRAHQQVRRARS